MSAHPTKFAAAVLAACASIGAHAAVASATAAGAPAHAGAAVKTFNLNGYVVNTAYTQGPNTRRRLRHELLD